MFLQMINMLEKYTGLYVSYLLLTVCVTFHISGFVIPISVEFSYQIFGLNESIGQLTS